MNKYKTTKELGTMRLIDADNLEKAIAQYFKSHIIDNSCTVDAVDCAWDMRRLVEEQPTAYDAGKVVEQLEVIKENEYGACEGENCGHCKYFNTCWDGEMSDKLALDKAIKIVKGGGIDE